MKEPRYLRCYRLTARWEHLGILDEAVWALVQRHGGEIAIRSDVIDYWIPESYEELLLLAFPELDRRRDLDYVI